MTGSGEVVEVRAGGHIVRAGGRKDRHSKVCTAKGVRDRRVRLSAHTAIQFYDVQDRLGYDRPSKAVDWLIRNAKPAIDRLSQRHQSPQKPPFSSGDYGFCGSSSCFLPPSLDSDSIADTIRSFFPTAAAAATAASSSSSYHPDEDLRLSLQSFQDPIFGSQQQCRGHQAALFGFDAGSSAWLEPSQRAAAWNLVQTQLAAQWGTLQSSNPPSVRADGDPTSLPHQLNLAGEVVGFSGYQVQGGEEAEEEEQRAPSFASSALRH